MVTKEISDIQALSNYRGRRFDSLGVKQFITFYPQEFNYRRSLPFFHINRITVCSNLQPCRFAGLIKHELHYLV